MGGRVGMTDGELRRGRGTWIRGSLCRPARSACTARRGSLGESDRATMFKKWLVVRSREMTEAIVFGGVLEFPSAKLANVDVREPHDLLDRVEIRHDSEAAPR